MIEHRLSLSTWERERVEGLGLALGLGAAGIGIGAVALPLALVAGGVISALLLADNLDDMIDKIQALPEAILGDPNNLGGEKATKTITAELTEIDEALGASAFELYNQVN